MPRVYSPWNDPSVGQHRRLDVLRSGSYEMETVYARVHYLDPEPWLTKHVVKMTERNQQLVTENDKAFKLVNRSSSWNWLELCDPAWLEWLVDKISQIPIKDGRLQLFSSRLTAQVLVCLTDTSEAPAPLKTAELWKRCYGAETGRHDTSGSEILALNNATGDRVGTVMRCRLCGHLIRTS